MIKKTVFFIEILPLFDEVKIGGQGTFPQVSRGLLGEKYCPSRKKSGNLGPKNPKLGQNGPKMVKFREIPGFSGQKRGFPRKNPC